MKTNLSVLCVVVFFFNFVIMAAEPVVLNYTSDGTFKIVQFTDTHLEVPEEIVKTDEKSLKRKAWIQTTLDNMMKTIDSVLEKENPNLVVFTGDNVLTSPKYLKNGWEILTAPVVKRNISWVAIMGNHDHEGGRTNEKVLSIISELPKSLAITGPKEVYGQGNYVIMLDYKKKATTPLYFLDSNAYAKIGGYDWLRFSQIDWFREQTAKITAANNGVPLPSLAFFHIPLPEYEDAYSAVGGSSRHVGIRGESGCWPKINSGMFASMFETKSVMGVFTGHDHDSDYAVMYHNICLAYGRKTGHFCYLNHLRSGARVIKLFAGKRSFESWIRNDQGDVIDPFLFPDFFTQKK
ncbi:MAG: metallophosphoesterase family protein [Lentisphaeria bacterium]